MFCRTVCEPNLQILFRLKVNTPMTDDVQAPLDKRLGAYLKNQHSQENKMTQEWLRPIYSLEHSILRVKNLYYI